MTFIFLSQLTSTALKQVYDTKRAKPRVHGPQHSKRATIRCRNPDYQVQGYEPTTSKRLQYVA